MPAREEADKSKKIEDAISVAIGQILKPNPEILPDLSNISAGMMPLLISTKAYLDQIPRVFAQIEARQKWYSRHFVEKAARLELYKFQCAKRAFEEKPENKDKKFEFVIYWTPEKRKEEIEKLDKIFEADNVDATELFGSKVLDAYYHHSRGKDHYTLDKAVLLKDTELQVRNAPDDDSEKPEFRHGQL